MTRSVKNWKPLSLTDGNIIEDKPIFPDTDDIMFIEDFASYGWKSDPLKSWNMNLFEARRIMLQASPINKGDIVWAKTLSDRRRFLILGVFAEHQKQSDKWILKYKAQPFVKSAQVFSKHWQYIYPGYISRGYDNG